MILRRTLVSPTLPVTVDEANAQLRLTEPDEGGLIYGLIAAAVDLVGSQAGRVLATETWVASVPCVPSVSGWADLILPKNPVQGLTSITYFDTNDVSQVAALADFYVYSDADQTLIRPKNGKSWPVTIAREDAISVTFVAGYVALPPALRAAILLTVGHLFENREAVLTGPIAAELPLGVRALIDPYRLNWLAA